MAESIAIAHAEKKRIYVLVWVTLLCMTALTTGVAYIDLGPWNTVAALAIAIFKASLVVLFFMHARHSEHLVRIVIVCAIFWLLILIGVSMTDFSTRNRVSHPTWFRTNQPSVFHHLEGSPY